MSFHDQNRPTLAHLDPACPAPTLFFWKMFKIVWNGEKSGFLKLPTWPTPTLILKNAYNDLKWHKIMFLENDLTAQPAPTHLLDAQWTEHSS